MHIQGRASGWYGPVRSFSLALSVLLLAGACAAWPPSFASHGARDHLRFLADAMTADLPAREAMWQSVAVKNPSMQDTLYRALLQSVPGHAGYNAANAERNLEELLKRDPPADIAVVAQVRLEELRATREMRAELQSMKERLSRVVDIERQMKSNQR